MKELYDNVEQNKMCIRRLNMGFPKESFWDQYSFYYILNDLLQLKTDTNKQNAHWPHTETIQQPLNVYLRIYFGPVYSLLRQIWEGCPKNCQERK